MSNVFVKIDRRFVESKSSSKKQPIKRSVTVSDAYPTTNDDDDEDIDSIHLFTYDQFRFPPSTAQSHPSPVAEEESTTLSSSEQSPPVNNVIVDEDVFDEESTVKSSDLTFDDVQLNNVDSANVCMDDDDDGDRSPDSIESPSCAGPWQTKCSIL